MSIKERIFEMFARRELKKQSKEGTMVGKIWDWLNGKKTVVGAVITIVAFAPEIIAQLPNFGVSPEDTARVLGIAVTVVGLLHKAYKFIYREEHP